MSDLSELREAKQTVKKLRRRLENETAGEKRDALQAELQGAIMQQRKIAREASEPVVEPEPAHTRKFAII